MLTKLNEIRSPALTKYIKLIPNNKLTITITVVQCTLLEIFSSLIVAIDQFIRGAGHWGKVCTIGTVSWNPREIVYIFKKIVMKNIELLETVLPDIKRANLGLGIINPIQSYHSKLLLFVFFFLPILTYFSFFHTHLSDIPYEFNCDFLDSHSTMTICSLARIYTAFSVLRKLVRFLRINVCILKT